MADSSCQRTFWNLLITYTPGKYRAEVLDQGFTEASTGTPMFFLQLRITKKYAPDGSLVDCPVYERTYRRAVTEKALGLLIGDLKAIGVEFDSLAQLDPEASDAINLIGEEIEVLCEHETWNGKQQERWGIYRERGKKLDLSAVRELSEAFGHLLKK